ncbi:MAG: hypothetical protein AAGI30_01380 [Planctomycetota bacterium]
MTRELIVSLPIAALVGAASASTLTLGVDFDFSIETVGGGTYVASEQLGNVVTDGGGPAGNLISDDLESQIIEDANSFGPTNDPAWDITGLELGVSTNPSLSLATSVTNSTSVDQTFVLTAFVISTVDFLPGTVQVQGTTSIDVADAGVDGVATVSVPAGSFGTEFLIEGVAEESIFAAGTTSPPIPFVGGGEALAGSPANFGPQASVLGNIDPGDVVEIVTTVTVSAGDTVTVNNVFVITGIIPAPGAAGLLAVAGIAAARRRR